MAKDWVGGNAAVFKTLGASNHKTASDSVKTTMPQNPQLPNGSVR